MNGIKKMVTATIDDIQVTVEEGTTILKAAQSVGIKIPTLCQHDDLKPKGLCRVCVVEIEGYNTLQTSCTLPVSDGMVINSNSHKVRKARRDLVDLELSSHTGTCYTCNRSRNCTLRELADECGVTEFRFGVKEEPEHEIEDSGLFIVRDMNKCVQCRNCERACKELQAVGAYGMKDRSNQIKIAAFADKDLEDTVCINCGQCITHCPTGALSVKDETEKVWELIEDPTKHVVIQTSPAPRTAIGECFGNEPGAEALTMQLPTALRRCGFDRVFDTTFTADLTIIEEATELLLRLKKVLVDKDETVALPQFTSCSPGWVKYLEHFKPEMIPNLSSAKSPGQMFGAVIKTYYAEKNNIDPKDIVSVALMPCTAKKFECNRPEMDDSGFKDVDYMISTEEVAAMIKEAGMDLRKVPTSEYDNPFGVSTGSGVIFGATGGVMEAALRTAIEVITGIKVEDLFDHANITPVRGFEGSRVAEIKIEQVGPVPDILKGHFDNWDWLKGATLKVGVAHGTANAEKVLADIEAGGPFSECHFIEFMGCPGGCIAGGGMPRPVNMDIRKARASTLYNEDMVYETRKSHENPDVAHIYSEFLTDGPCGHKAHKLLHTSYTARGKLID